MCRLRLSLGIRILPSVAFILDAINKETSMFKKKIIFGTLAALTACTAIAEESKLSYTYVGLGYQTGEVLDEDFSGFGIAGSAALNESLYLIGAYSSLSSDDQLDVGFGADDVDVTQLNFGVGFHTPINTSLDFFTDLSFAKAEIEYLSASEDGNGYLINAGLRGKPTDNFEFGASINYADIEDEGETGYSVSARVFVDPKISLGLGYGSADDVDTVSFNVRFDI